MRFIITWIILFIGLWSKAQTKELTYLQFMEVVRQNHPLMMKANQVVNAANANFLMARGEFDPKIEGDFNQKEFSNKKYYSLINAGLKVPTWLGINLNAGYDQSYGDYISAMDYTPSNGLVYAGVEIPLGQGLFFDKRRSAFRKAEFYQEMSSYDRDLLVNELIFEVSVDYWNWFEQHHQLLAVNDLLEKSKIRLENVKTSALKGDKPYIDTLEATIQYQNFLNAQMEIEMLEKNARAFLGVHLWADGIIPLELEDTTIPESISNLTIVNYYNEFQDDSIIQNHPKLVNSRIKMEIQEIDLRMSKELLKPKVNLKYNLLNEPIGGDYVGFNPNDYKFGLDVSIPLFLRNARGNVQRSKAELLMAEYDMQLTEQQLEAKFVATLNKSQTSVNQVNLLRQNMDNYSDLVEAERKLYQIGESSLMMLNYREIAYLETKLKWVQKMSSAKIAEIEILYALGKLQ